MSKVNGRESASYSIVFVLIENGVAGSDFKGNL